MPSNTCLLYTSNRVLCCNYVYFDGVRYTRKESNVPELNQQIEGLKSLVVNQILQKVRTLNPALEWSNQLAMRCVQSGAYRIEMCIRDRIKSYLKA